MFIGTAEQAFDGSQFEEYLSAAQLIFTSPPFPLNRKKHMGISPVKLMLIGLQALLPVSKDTYARMVRL